MLAKTANALNSGLDATTLQALTEFLAPFLWIGVAVAATVYVLYAVGLYTIAKRRGIYYAWLAWLPLSRNWVVGKISDQYQIARRYHYTINAPALVILEVVTCGLEVATVLVFEKLVLIITRLQNWSGEKVTQTEYQLWVYPLEQNFNNTMFFLNVVGILTVVAAVAYMIVYYRAHYDLFASCRPDLKVVFLVLSIVFPVTLPFFVFACRKHDQGLAEQPKQENSIAGKWADGQVFTTDT